MFRILPTGEPTVPWHPPSRRPGAAAPRGMHSEPSSGWQDRGADGLSVRPSSSGPKIAPGAPGCRDRIPSGGLVKGWYSSPGVRGGRPPGTTTSPGSPPFRDFPWPGTAVPDFWKKRLAPRTRPLMQVACPREPAVCRGQNSLGPRAQVGTTACFGSFPPVVRLLDYRSEGLSPLPFMVEFHAGVFAVSDPPGILPRPGSPGTGLSQLPHPMRRSPLIRSARWISAPTGHFWTADTAW